MLGKIFLLLFFIVSFPMKGTDLFACDTCGCTLARVGSETHKPETLHRWFVDFTFEQQNWDEIPPDQAHELHHEGHHVHDKTTEEFYHFGTGTHPNERMTVFAQIPYVVRGSLEIHEHETLGQKEHAEGLGDLKLTGIYRFLKENENFLGIVAGVKFPTGETEETNSHGELFEPEFQPGSGSFDYIVGVAFGYEWSLISFRGNGLYFFKTEGDQDFEFGDLFTSYIFIHYLLNSQSERLKVRPGIDMNFQIEEKQEEEGIEIDDSGGTTLFIGPALTVEVNDHIKLLGNVLFPAYQNLGGRHQEVDFIWNLSLRLLW